MRRVEESITNDRLKVSFLPMRVFFPFCPAGEESSAKSLFPFGLFEVGQGGLEEEKRGASSGEDVDPVVSRNNTTDAEVSEGGLVVVGAEVSEDGFAPGVEGGV